MVSVRQPHFLPILVKPHLMNSLCQVPFGKNILFSYSWMAVKLTWICVSRSSRLFSCVKPKMITFWYYMKSLEYCNRIIFSSQSITYVWFILRYLRHALIHESTGHNENSRQLCNFLHGQFDVHLFFQQSTDMTSRNELGRCVQNQALMFWV